MMNRKSRDPALAIVNELIAEMELLRKEPENQRFDANFGIGITHCQRLADALRGEGIDQVVREHRLLERVIDDSVPWEGQILGLAQRLKSTVSSIRE